MAIGASLVIIPVKLNISNYTSVFFRPSNAQKHFTLLPLTVALIATTNYSMHM